jgi:hypothetical protein
MEADAIGTRSKEENMFSQSDPNSVDMTFWSGQYICQMLTYIN